MSVLPSYSGGRSAFIARCSMGKPVITKDVVGCREAVEHGRTGLMVPIKDSAALAEAMAGMIGNPEVRLEMGLTGQEKW